MRELSIYIFILQAAVTQPSGSSSSATAPSTVTPQQTALRTVAPQQTAPSTFIPQHVAASANQTTPSAQPSKPDLRITVPASSILLGSNNSASLNIFTEDKPAITAVKPQMIGDTGSLTEKTLKPATFTGAKKTAAVGIAKVSFNRLQHSKLEV